MSLVLTAWRTTTAAVQTTQVEPRVGIRRLSVGSVAAGTRPYDSSPAAPSSARGSSCLRTAEGDPGGPAVGRGVRAYVRGFDDRFRGGRDDAASRRLGVDYIEEVTAIGEDQEPAKRHGSAADPNCSPRAAATAVADRDRETGPSR